MMIETIIAIVFFLFGRFSVRKEPTNDLEHLESDNKKLREDIAYYKKLCKTLSEENMEFRRKL